MSTQSTNWFQDEGEVLKPQEETPAESSSGKNEDESVETPENEPVPTQDKPLEEEIPFHKHPRFRALINENKELKETLSRIEERLNEPAIQPEPTDNIPQWFINLYGDDKDVWNGYKEQLNFQKQEMEQSILSKLSPTIQEIEQEKQRKSIDQDIETSIKELEDGGHKFDRNALMKVVYDNQLFDANGRLNFKAGLAMLPKQPADKAVEEKKAIAAKTSPTSGEKPTRDYMTSEDVRNKDWRSFYHKL